MKTKVADAIKKQRAKDQLEQKAKDLVASLTVRMQSRPPVKKKALMRAPKSRSNSAHRSAKQVSDGARRFDLQPETGEFSKTPIKVDDKWVIVGVTKRNDADLTGLAAQRDTLKQSMMSERQDQVFEDYIAGVQQRMKRDGKIKIYQEVLAQLEEPAAEPGFPPGLNFPIINPSTDYTDSFLNLS